MQILFSLVVDTFNAGGMLSRILLDFHMSGRTNTSKIKSIYVVLAVVRDFCIT